MQFFEAFTEIKYIYIKALLAIPSCNNMGLYTGECFSICNYYCLKKNNKTKLNFNYIENMWTQIFNIYHLNNNGH